MDSEERKERILEMQFESAMNGSVEMLKWLGIQYCGQDNKPTLQSNNTPSGFNVSVIGSDGQVLDDCPSCRRAKAKEERNTTS